MRRKSLLLLGFLAVVTVAVLSVRPLLTSGLEDTEAGQSTSLPYGAPIGMEDVTPGPAFTPIAPRAGVDLVASADARELGEKVAGMNGAIDPATMSVALGQAGDRNFPQYAPSYPLWIVTARGIFVPARGPLRSQGREFNQITVFIDAVKGGVVAVEMTEPSSS